jgi:hypothetical protein
MGLLIRVCMSTKEAENILATVIDMQECLIANEDISWFAAEIMHKAVDDLLRLPLVFATDKEHEMHSKAHAQKWLMEERDRLDAYGLLEDAKARIGAMYPVTNYNPS